LLPYDYESYGKEIALYLEAAQKNAAEHLGDKAPKFDAVLAAARRFSKAGAGMNNISRSAEGAAVSLSSADLQRANRLLLATERALLLPKGLPRRPWFRHAIYAPADLKGYSASTIPGVNEAIQRDDAVTVARQVQELTDALNRATGLLESYTSKAATDFTDQH